MVSFHPENDPWEEGELSDDSHDNHGRVFNMAYYAKVRGEIIKRNKEHNEALIFFK